MRFFPQFLLPSFLKRLIPLKPSLKHELEQYYGTAKKYHCNEHEMLMKGLKSTREVYGKVGLEEKKTIAGKELEQWKMYIHFRTQSIPPSFSLTLFVQQRLTRTWNRFYKHRQLSSDQLQLFFRLYMQNYFGDQFSSRVSLKMIIREGYIARIKTMWTLGKVIELMKIQTLVSFESSIGQKLLAKQLVAFNYWLCMDSYVSLSTQLGYLPLSTFKQLLLAFNIDTGTSIGDIRKELSWVLKDLPGDLDGMTDETAIIRFEVFRRLFIDWNL